MRRSALLTAPIALGALVAGYLWGFGVGEREGHDSDPLAGFDDLNNAYWVGHRHGQSSERAVSNGG